jgi:hypothetical protein
MVDVLNANGIDGMEHAAARIDIPAGQQKVAKLDHAAPGFGCSLAALLVVIARAAANREHVLSLCARERDARQAEVGCHVLAVSIAGIVLSLAENTILEKAAEEIAPRRITGQDLRRGVLGAMNAVLANAAIDCRLHVHFDICLLGA